METKNDCHRPSHNVASQPCSHRGAGERTRGRQFPVAANSPGRGIHAGLLVRHQRAHLCQGSRPNPRPRRGRGQQTRGRGQHRRGFCRPRRQGRLHAVSVPVVDGHQQSRASGRTVRHHQGLCAGCAACHWGNRDGGRSQARRAHRRRLHQARKVETRTRFCSAASVPAACPTFAASCMRSAPASNWSRCPTPAVHRSLSISWPAGWR